MSYDDDLAAAVASQSVALIEANLRADSAEAELRETAGELEKGAALLKARISRCTELEKRLTEATALLERWNRLSLTICEELQDDTTSFLSRNWMPARAPAQPAAPTPVPMHLECPKCGTVHVDTWDDAGIDWSVRPHKTHLCLHCGELWKPAEFPTVGVPAAPEPSADKLSELLRCALSWEPGARLLGNVTAGEIARICQAAQLNEALALRWEEASEGAEERIDALGEKLESAEAQLAAVRKELRYWKQEPFARSWPSASEMLDRIDALLTPAPSPGAGEKP